MNRSNRARNVALAGLIFMLGTARIAAQVRLTSAQDSDLINFPASTTIIAAEWNYFPSGALNVIQIPGADVHPMTWADDGNIYGAHNDPLTNALPIDPSQNWNRTEISQTAGSIDEGSPGLSQAVVTGMGVGNPMTQPENDLSYTIGLVSVGGFLFGTHSGSYNDVALLNLDGNGQGPFRGIEWSGDHGLSWNRVSQPNFSGYEASAGHLQSLNFVQIGQDAPAADGYIYAITFDVEFAGSLLRIGKVQWNGDPNYTANLANWQWATAFDANGQPVNWQAGMDGAANAASIPGSSASQFMNQKLTYPTITYDPQAGVYLLACAMLNYTNDATGGSRFVLFEGPNPWGPFNFVAQDGGASDPYYSRRLKYGNQVLAKFQSAISSGIQNLYETHSGAYSGLGCSSIECTDSNDALDYGDYGTYYRILQLTFAGTAAGPATSAGR